MVMYEEFGKYDDVPSLRERFFESKVLFIIFLISLIWTISIFAAPYTISPGTVTDLEGNANRLDFQEIWDEMPPFPRVIYYLGDAECHQISNRTIYLNGNQMPVCARDVSIFLFLTVGFLVSSLLRKNYYISAGILSMFPKRFREFARRTMGEKWFAISFALLCLAPVAIDGGIQLFTQYESTNTIRFLTGMPAGFVAGLLVGVMIKSVQATRELAREVRQDVE